MYDFKIWNQANDGNTMAIRAADVSVVALLGPAISRPSDDGVYPTLAHYLAVLGNANTAPPPYRRTIDVLWRTAIGYGAHRYFPRRILEVTYSGNVRQAGGFAAQCYVVVDPQGYASLGGLHLAPIAVDVFPGSNGDLLEVTV
jgi:hypothetical protein